MPNPLGPHAPHARQCASASVATLLLLAAADMTAVSTLLPVIAHAVDGERLLPWLMSAFMAAMALAGIGAGALADRHGVRAILSLGAMVFIAASAGAAMATGIWTLLAARVGQGVGAGMLIVLAYSSLAVLHGPVHRSRAQGMIGLAWGGAAAVGPLLGMLASHYVSWRLVFWVNVPAGLLCLSAFRASFPPAVLEHRTPPYDGIAQAAFAVLVCAAMTALSAQALALTAATGAGLLAVVAVAACVLVARIRRNESAAPLPLAFLRSRSLRSLLIIVPCASMGLYASITFLPVILSRQAGGESATAAAPGTAAAAIGFVIASVASARLFDLLGCRRLMTIGLASLSAGCLAIALAPAPLVVAWIVAAQWLTGQGMGIVAVAAVLHAQECAPHRYLSTYTSAIQVLRNIGAALGINLFASLDALAARLQTHATVSTDAFRWLALALALCALPAQCLPSKPRVRNAPHEGTASVGGRQASG